MNPSHRPVGTARPPRGPSAKDLSLERLETRGWYTRGGFTAQLREALRATGHAKHLSKLPGWRFCPGAYRVRLGEVQTIHLQRGEAGIAAGTLKHYLAVAKVLKLVSWDFQPFVLHTDDNRLLPLNLDAHRVTP